MTTPAEPPFDGSPPPGAQAIVLTALAIGTLLVGLQLWLLTVALDLYLAGHGRGTWLLVFVSGLVFCGGLLAVRLVGRVLPSPGR
jgi:hypothetical protein